LGHGVDPFRLQTDSRLLIATQLDDNLTAATVRNFRRRGDNLFGFVFFTLLFSSSCKEPDENHQHRQDRDSHRYPFLSTGHD
jgi:hypothetical protein